MTLSTRFRRTAMLAVAATLCFSLFAPTPKAAAATINFSSIETVLSDPDNMAAKMHALWVGWGTQVYEYNMPFIELSNDPGELGAIEEFRMTIGNTNYNFGNEFLNKHKTNSWHIPTNGEYALAGMSTPDIDFDTRVEDGGDTLVIDFGPSGLQPGETVRFQVDINPDAGNPDAMTFADYTSVFFQVNGDDPTDNSIVRIEYANSDAFAQVQLPELTADADHVISLSNPRPYNQMQGIEVFGDIPIETEIPEPAALALGLMGVGATLARRRG